MADTRSWQYEHAIISDSLVSLKHVTAYSKPLQTAPQTIIFRLQFNYEKTRGFYVHAVLVGRLSRRWTGGLHTQLTHNFFPAG